MIKNALSNYPALCKLSNKIKINRIITYLSLLIFFIVTYAFLLFSSARKLTIDIINNKPENFKKNFLNWQILTFWIRPINQFNNMLPDLVGINEDKSYFLLLQNNGELRPSGGFIGSYAKVTFSNGGLANIQIQDIYVPDGQIIGHVKPPWPIQQAFQQGFWRLRDSNWKIDFPSAAKDISWFFQKSKEEKPDGLIAINLIPILDLLKITGPINLSDYSQKVSADNLINVIQKHTEQDFFPGSTQKKDILSSFAANLFLELKSLSPKQSFQLAKAIYNNLQQSQILVYFKNENTQSFFNKLNWTGQLKRKNNQSDFIYIVDTNLSSNKANLYVTRSAEQKINLNNNKFNETLTIKYFNSSTAERPNIENNFWGGTYKNYLRIVLPIEAKVKKIKINDELLKTKKEIKEYKDINLQSIGFFVEVPPQSQTTATINYQLPYNKTKYRLEVLKQPGIDSYPHIIVFNEKKHDLIIKHNHELKFANPHYSLLFTIY
jgi:hypothetical protein